MAVKERVRGGATIDQYIGRQDPSYQPLLKRLRTLVMKAVPDIEEKIMWGQPVFAKGKEKVVFLYVTGDHVNYGFFRAAELKDPKGRLEGTGKGMRHIKVRAAADIDEAYFSTLTKQAAALLPK